MQNWTILLAESGLSKAALGRKLGISADTISRWRLDPPEYALAYLRLYVDGENRKDRFKTEVLKLLDNL